MTTPVTPLPLGHGRYGGGVVNPAQRQLIEASSREGLSGTATQTRLSQAGLGLRRQAILAVRREITGRVSRIPALASIRKDFRPTQETITLTQENISRKFRYTLRVFVRNPFSGVQETSWAQFVRDDILTVREAEDAAVDISRRGGFGFRPDEGGSQTGDFLTPRLVGVEQRAI